MIGIELLNSQLKNDDFFDKNAIFRWLEKKIVATQFFRKISNFYRLFWKFSLKLCIIFAFVIFLKSADTSVLLKSIENQKKNRNRDKHVQSFFCWLNVLCTASSFRLLNQQFYESRYESIGIFLSLYIV